MESRRYIRKNLEASSRWYGVLVKRMEELEKIAVKERPLRFAEEIKTFGQEVSNDELLGFLSAVCRVSYFPHEWFLDVVRQSSQQIPAHELWSTVFNIEQFEQKYHELCDEAHEIALAVCALEILNTRYSENEIQKTIERACEGKQITLDSARLIFFHFLESKSENIPLLFLLVKCIKNLSPESNSLHRVIFEDALSSFIEWYEGLSKTGEHDDVDIFLKEYPLSLLQKMINGWTGGGSSVMSGIAEYVGKNAKEVPRQDAIDFIVYSLRKKWRERRVVTPMFALFVQDRQRLVHDVNELAKNGNLTRDEFKRLYAYCSSDGFYFARQTQREAEYKEFLTELAGVSDNLRMRGVC